MADRDASRRAAVSLVEISSALGHRLTAATGDAATKVEDVTHDSREVRSGSGTLFCCVRGATADGHDFAEAAVRNGAVAMLVDHELIGVEVPQIVVDDVRAAMGPVAAEVHHRPSSELAVIGVTGTNGKTTVVSFVAHIVEAAGRRCAEIGTLTGARTTPEATDLQRQLRVHADNDMDVVAMEVSSHALDLHRVDGVEFAVAAFTNLGRDHLDHHGSLQRYFEAKARLFEPGWARTRIVDVDDAYGRRLRDGGSVDTAVSLDPLAVVVDASGASMTWRGHRVRVPVPGRFNAANAVLAAECCSAIGIDDSTVAGALGTLSAPPGRFEQIVAPRSASGAGPSGADPTVIVDFAHTPDALERVLSAARDLLDDDGRLVVVFGCGGDRDPSKRERMGEVADRSADRIVITSDNPRSEDPSTIMAAVRAGIRTNEPVLELDRRAAITAAIAGARPGDVVVIAGKGHETTQTVGTTIFDFDDRQVAADALEARNVR